MGSAPQLDRDLHDDMLKLVRYKVLFVRREYEVAFPEQEDLVSDNIEGSAFTAWKIAEFVQNLTPKDPNEPIPDGHTLVPQRWIDKSYAEEYWSDKESGGYLTGIPHEDKKYLRVYYEVLDRYPREKFKYEEQQIRILEQIRDRLAKPRAAAGGSAFDALWQRLDSNTRILKKLRRDFQLGSKKLGTALAKVYSQYNEYGEFPAPKSISEKSLQDAFAQGLKPQFSSAGLESFINMYSGLNRLYDFNTKAEIKTGEPPWYMTWEKGTETPDLYIQRVVGSMEKNYTSDSLPDLSQRKVDLALNVYRKDIGITGWLTTWVQFRSEMALISYEIEQGTFLWIGQVLTPDLKIPPGMNNRFWMFLEWIAPEGGAYYMYGLQFDINFKESSLSVVTSSPDPKQPVGVRKSHFKAES